MHYFTFFLMLECTILHFLQFLNALFYNFVTLEECTINGNYAPRTACGCG